MNDDALVKQLIPLWYAERKWAEELLCRCFLLRQPEDILREGERGVGHSIPGTNWMYRAHGIGVDIYKTDSAGGIDFDFDKPDPDEWRLRIFAEKQYHCGNLCYRSYRDLIEEEERLKKAIASVLKARAT